MYFPLQSAQTFVLITFTNPATTYVSLATNAIFPCHNHYTIKDGSLSSSLWSYWLHITDSHQWMAVTHGQWSCVLLFLFLTTDTQIFNILMLMCSFKGYISLFCHNFPLIAMEHFHIQTIIMTTAWIRSVLCCGQHAAVSLGSMAQSRCQSCLSWM